MTAEQALGAVMVVTAALAAALGYLAVGKPRRRPRRAASGQTARCGCGPCAMAEAEHMTPADAAWLAGHGIAVGPARDVTGGGS